ncbi:pleckstrin homology domain-containing family G member 4B-like isoform 1-T1 [Odontesthes bonariensis]|uniref:pleckstrin homology domain-containing family G member 4B-like isoform X1 n=1 Tax=Odontesthes bonariensis TaxID=219752 RepID=UPI003F5863B0
MNLDSVEGSIQNLLSVLYPPFDATAPTLLSQLFQIIGSRYQGDALRCYLDFLVPAKHILDTVQQAACAQYSDGLFLCEGWPLCLRDQVVVHLAPIDPLLLRPGDFYLQVAPFCDQSARIVVCSLLEEAGFAEETPIDETSYPCIFSHDWLDDINHDRSGTPLRQCLLATEQGLVRLPWERVAVPEFVDVPRSAGSSMASAPPSYSPLPLPLPPPLPNFPENCSYDKSSPLSSSKESAVKQHPVTIQNSTLTSSSQPFAFTVETRICPAKHGIAVSLCLVDTSAATSQLVKVKETDTESKPIGWVSPNTWDSRFTGINPNTTTKTSTVSETRTTANSSITECKDEKKGVIVPENTLQDKQKDTKVQDMSRCGPVAHTVAEGEYIDILQASMLFGNDQSLTEQQSLVQQRRQSDSQMQRYPHRQSQLATQLPLSTETQVHGPLPTKSQSHSRSVDPLSLSPNMSAQAGPPSINHHSQTHLSYCDPLEPSQCVRTVRFAEKPCTPCMERRQGGKATRAQDLRCRYRDSYQAAIQNPVSFRTEKDRGNLLAVVEEDGDFSQCDKRRGQLGTEPEDPWCDVQGIRCDQHPPSLTEDICEESGEINTVSHWKPGDSNLSPSVEYRKSSTLQFVGQPDHVSEKNSAAFSDAQSPKSYGTIHNVNRTNPAAEARINANVVSGTNGLIHSDVSSKHHRLPLSSREISGMHLTFKTHEKLQNRTSSNLTSLTAPQNGGDTVSDRRGSSLSTAVVDTSEKCELVIVEGQNVRRKENLKSRPEVPQLHVVKCKNSTAFRLVSPKINRKMTTVGEQPGSTPISSGNGHQTEKPSKTDPPPMTEKQKVSQRASARPRPDHLPLGPPDPRAHPLYLGVASLTGCRDRTGRAIIELYGEHQGWRSAVTSQELFQMLIYFHSITRKEIREAGMTLIFDARRTNPQPQLYKALMALQEQCPSAVNSFVLLVDKENSLRPERCPGIQTDVVTSMKALLKLAEVNQLSSRLDGTLSHSYCDWMELHQRLFPFVNDLHEASSLLLRAIWKLEEPQMTDTVQTVQQCMMDQRTLMRDVLEDIRLVRLQREGGAILARLRKESDLKYPHCEDLSDAVDSVTSLYNHVEEQAHVLVQRTNMSLEHLEYLMQLREIEGHFKQILQWFTVEGERHLLEAESVEESGDRMEQILNSFTAFLIEANDRRHHSMSLVSEAERLQQSGLSYPETDLFRNFVCTFKSGLEDFLCRAETCGRELQIMVNVCDFCEQATALASECIVYLNQNPSRFHPKQDHDRPSQVNQPISQPVQYQNQDSSPNTASLCQSDVHAAHCSGSTTASVSPSSTDSFILQAFKERFLHFSPERFQEVKAQASALRGSRGMRVWNVAWLRCQEARQQLQERMQDVDEVYHQQADWNEGHFIDVVSTNVETASPGGQNLVVQSTPGPGHPQWERIVSGVVDLERRRPALTKPEDSSDAGMSRESTTTPKLPHRSTKKTEREARRRQTSRARSDRDAAALSQSQTVGCQWFPWGRGLGARSVSEDSCAARVAAVGSSTPPEQGTRPPSSCSHRGQPSCRILQEAQKFQISRHGSFCSDDSCMSDQGAAGGNGTVCCKHSSLPIRKYDGAFCASPLEIPSSALRLQRVMEELVFTEREYVRSLGYILTHYLPLMDRLDIPQDLRGKRGVIFGNLEKLYDFHSHYFLPELEACERDPAMIARCFLRHSESFGLYALYSKNKPQSDALILHRRHDIFKKKQQELGDMMDLSSYLLRPIQRISKYSLLLQDMLSLARSYRPKDVNQDTASASGLNTYVPDLTSNEREKAEIQAAADLVRFQMRHGNDLLTMDAIQDCDVNLKEQGQLIRQDEFTVFFRKKKCVRRIFLFEDLIIFSKPKRTDVGNDVYVYKQSFKTNDIGMTHNSGVSGLCFEIWFRRRKSEDTYTLKAASMEVKKAWTTDLERLLWDQAAHSRELRLQERVFMGMGRKPFMDIQHSDAAICDRAISCVPPRRIPVTYCSHRGLEYPRPHSIGSGSTASTTLSQSSSSSGRGSLPPAGYPGNASQGTDMNPAICSSPEAVTDNELNNHHLHHHCEPWKAYCPLMDSTESSGENMTHMFSSSDHSCLSAISGEVVDDSSVLSESPQQQSPLCRTSSLRKNSSPAVTRKKPGVPPKPLQPAKAQGNEIIIGKSTEV